MPESNHNMLLSFILLLIIAALTAYYASKKGRNTMIWFVLGLLLGVFAPLILLFLPKLKPEGDGLPTMTLSKPDPYNTLFPEIPPTPDDQKLKEEENKLWYYLDQEHIQIGPVSAYALRELWNRGRLDLNSYVWSEGMANWEKVDDLPDLKDVLNSPSPL